MDRQIFGLRDIQKDQWTNGQNDQWSNGHTFLKRCNGRNEDFSINFAIFTKALHDKRPTYPLLEMP